MIENLANAGTVNGPTDRDSEQDNSQTRGRCAGVGQDEADESVAAMNQPDASNLCVSCGLCCNGVLYSNIKAERDEVPRLEAAGHPVEQLGERFQFHPPCHHHIDGRCSIYATRFTKCRTFRCALLKRLDAGEVSLTEASAAVVKSKEMVGRIARLDPNLALLTHRVTLRRDALSPSESGKPGATEKLFESVALDMWLDRTFRNKPVINFQG